MVDLLRVSRLHSTRNLSLLAVLIREVGVLSGERIGIGLRFEDHRLISCHWMYLSSSSLSYSLVVFLVRFDRYHMKWRICWFLAGGRGVSIYPHTSEPSTGANWVFELITVKLRELLGWILASIGTIAKLMNGYQWRSQEKVNESALTLSFIHIAHQNKNHVIFKFSPLAKYFTRPRSTTSLIYILYKPTP